MTPGEESTSAAADRAYALWKASQIAAPVYEHEVDDEIDIDMDMDQCEHAYDAFKSSLYSNDADNDADNDDMVDDEEDYVYQQDESQCADNDNDNDNGDDEEAPAAPSPSSSPSSSSSAPPLEDSNIFTLAEELRALEEEEMEAAVNTLLQQNPTHPSAAATAAASASSNFPPPSPHQMAQFQTLMNQHYQILLQQTTLVVRSAQENSDDQSTGMECTTLLKRKRGAFFMQGESTDDLADIVDGTVKMLKDLDECRKDSIRSSIQMRRVRAKKDEHSAVNAANAVNELEQGAKEDEGTEGQQEPRLTRSAFLQTLHETDLEGDAKLLAHGFGLALTGATDDDDSSNLNSLDAKTTFGVKGLARLDETLASIEDSLTAYLLKGCSGAGSGAGAGAGAGSGVTLLDSNNIFEEPDVSGMCVCMFACVRACIGCMIASVRASSMICLTRSFLPSLLTAWTSLRNATPSCSCRL